MAPPSALTIATQSVQRLVKEEKYYHSELESQRARVKKLEDEMGSGSADENAEFVLRQERMAVTETEKMFGPLRGRIAEAVCKLEEQIALRESEGGEADKEELDKAREAIAAGQKVAQAE